jgi:hypothetical protein
MGGTAGVCWCSPAWSRTSPDRVISPPVDHSDGLLPRYHKISAWSLDLSCSLGCEGGVHAPDHQPRPCSQALLADCLAFDHLAAGGSLERDSKMSEAAGHGRMRFALSDGHTVGYSVVAPRFFDTPFSPWCTWTPPCVVRGSGGDS